MRAIRFAVWKAIADGVGVQIPEEFAFFGDDDVGIVIVLEEGRHLVDALEDVASPEQLAIGVDILVEQDVDIGKAQGKEQAIHEGHVDAGAGIEAGGDIAVAVRIVELRLLGVADDIVVGPLTEVDLRVASRP